MKTVILGPDQIEEAASLLREGQPVAMPTETVYGLAAPIFAVATVEKIFSLKKRPADNPLIAHISDLSMLDRIAEELPARFRRLIDRFWPGPLTIVLRKKAGVPSIVSAGQETIAVRMPSHLIALKLIAAVGEPLVAPSANLSGKPSPTCAEHVLEDFEGAVAAVLDGGECAFGIESTVLSLVGEAPAILRPGSIAAREIEDLLEMKLGAVSGGPILSPGMKYRHYAPKGVVRIVASEAEVAGPFVLSREPVGIHPFRRLEAKSLYRHLREADAGGVEEIFVLLDSVSAFDDALMNRLQKAAELDKVIEYA